jgi:hypothetical protein
MPSFMQTGLKSNAMCDSENTTRGYDSPVPDPYVFTSKPMARAGMSNIQGGIASTNTSSTPRKANLPSTLTASAPSSSMMTSKTTASLNTGDANLNNASTSSSYFRPALSNGDAPTFQDLIKKGRKAQADDERTGYETKKAKQEADRAKATRARLATDSAVRTLALDSRQEIDTCKGKLIDNMEMNLRALLEVEIRAEIREKVYKDAKKISAAHEREIKDSIKLQLEQDLEPVIMTELSAKHEETVKETLRVELQDEVKEELRVRYKADFEEDLRNELEDTVRKELKDMFRDEVRNELKRELSPSVRAELMGILGIQHTALEDLDDPQLSYPDLGNMQHLDCIGKYQGYGGESQYDEESGEDVYDDASEKLGSGVLDNDSRSNPFVNTDHFEVGSLRNDNLPNTIVNPNQFADDSVKNDNLPHPVIHADQSGSGSTSIHKHHLKRHIDEDYDDTDEEEQSGVDRPAEKRVKITPHDDLRADTPLANAGNINHIDEQAPDDGAQWEENNKNVAHFQVNGSINAYLGEEQLQKDGEGLEDGNSPLLNDNFDADCGREPLHNHEENQDFGHFCSENSNSNTYFGEEQPQDAKGLKAHESFPDLGGNAFGGNDNGREHDVEERPKICEDQHEEVQYETFADGDDGNAGYLKHGPILNNHIDEQQRDSEEDGSEEEEDEEDDEAEGEEDEEGDDEEDDDEEDHVGQIGLPYGCGPEPYRGRQINKVDRFLTRSREHYSSEEDDQDLSDTSLAYGRAQQPFGNHYGGTYVNGAPRVYSQGVKRFRSEEGVEDEVDEALQSKRWRGESYPISEEGYSEADSNEAEYESEGQDAQGGRQTYSLIKESNTQETAFVIDSDDDEDNSEGAEEEKTLVDDNDFLISKIQTYEEESLFVEG